MDPVRIDDHLLSADRASSDGGEISVRRSGCLAQLSCFGLQRVLGILNRTEDPVAVQLELPPRVRPGTGAPTYRTEYEDAVVAALARVATAEASVG